MAKKLAKQATTKTPKKSPNAKPTKAKAAKKIPKLASKPIKLGSGSQEDPAVIELLAKLDHPLKKEIEAIRQLILGLNPKIHEGVKWKAPSFKTSDDFATLHLHEMKSASIILHRGAKVKALPKGATKIADPQGLLKWLAADRCLVSLGAGKDFESNRAPLVAIIKEWLKVMMAD